MKTDKTQPKELCACGHTASYHTGVVGVCMYLHDGGHSCGCYEFNPVDVVTDTARLDELKARYRELCHAMQTGVAVNMLHTQETEPKHLRVGINAAMCEHAALVLLLMKKGFITEEEYFEAMIERMEAEVNSYADSIAQFSGQKVNLH